MTQQSNVVHLLTVLNTALQGGVGEMAKRFLHYRGLVRGAGDTLPELAQRIVNYVDDGSLTRADVNELLREFREASDKRVYLFRADKKALKKLDGGTYQRRISSMDDARVAHPSGSTVVSYSFITPERLRVSYAEPHRRFTFSPRSGQPAQWYSGIRIVVLDVDRTSGFVTVAMDSPWYEHPHGERAVDYFSHHLDVARATVGTPLLPVYLNDLLLRLEAEPRDRIKPADTRGLTQAGGKMRFSANGKDVRDDPEYRARMRDLALRDHGTFEWQKTSSELPDDGSPALLADIKVTIDANSSMVRFTKHTLSREMEYVLTDIRNLL